jgi:tetratricopeptide (TPR) repeat protein
MAPSKMCSSCRTKSRSAFAGVVEPALQAAEIRRATARPTSDLTAYDLYLRSIELARDWTREANLCALDLLEQAIERNPQYGLALARATFCHSQIVFSGWAKDPEPSRHQSIELARRALQVAGDDPIVLALAAGALANSDEDIEPLVGLIDRSLALNPGSAIGWMLSGWIRVFAGDSDRAVEHFKTALRLDPRSLARAFCLTGIGSAHFSAHRLEAAAAALQESLQLLPSYVTTYYFLASCLAHMGRLEEARDVVQRLRSFTGLLIPKDRSVEQIAAGSNSMLRERTLTPPANFIEPCLPRPANSPPTGPKWIHRR